MKLSRPIGLQAQSIREATARQNMWHGAVRSGKSLGSLLCWLDYVRTTPNDPLIMVAKTERTLRRNVVDIIHELIGPGQLQVNWGSGEARLWGKKIYLAGANDERSEGKIRGHTLGGAYGDELTLWPETFHSMLLSRCSLPGSKMFFTMNADAPKHWVKERYLDREDELDIAQWSFTIDDNTTLDPDYVANLKKEYVGLWFLRFIRGLWVLAEGSIYDMLDPEVHVVSKLPPMLKYFVAVDYGTVNPFHAILLGLSSPEWEDDGQGRIYCVDEWRWDSKAQQRQLTDAQYSEELRKWVFKKKKVVPASWWVDPSAVSFILQLAQDKVRHVNPANNQVLDGIRNVGTLFSGGFLRIHEDCQHLLKELYGYLWDEAKQERGEDAPMKADDHGPDALRYGIRGLIRIWRPWLKAA